MDSMQGITAIEHYSRNARTLRMIAELNHDEEIKHLVNCVATEYELIASWLARLVVIINARSHEGRCGQQGSIDATHFAITAL